MNESILEFEKYCKDLSNDQIYHIKRSLDTLINDAYFGLHYPELEELREALEFSCYRERIS